MIRTGTVVASQLFFIGNHVLMTTWLPFTTTILPAVSAFAVLPFSGPRITTRTTTTTSTNLLPVEIPVVRLSQYPTTSGIHPTKIGSVLVPIPVGRRLFSTPSSDDDDDNTTNKKILSTSSSSSSSSLLWSLLPADYEARARANNFASPIDIVEALHRPGTIVLDVRTDEEIAIAKWEGIVASSDNDNDTNEDEDDDNNSTIKKTTNKTNVVWVKTSCTPTECPDLEEDMDGDGDGGPSRFIPTKDTVVVVHCASGVRANRAKIILERQGYTNVLNAGGLKDLVVYPQMVPGRSPMGNA